MNNSKKNMYKTIAIVNLLIFFIFGNIISPAFADFWTNSDTTAPTLKFTSSTDKIVKWESVKLSRNAKDATSCNWIGWEIQWKISDISMWKVYAYPTSTTTYYMECFNDNWVSSGQKSITITVINNPKPTLWIKVTRKIIKSWKAVTISRKSTNATTCRATWWEMEGQISIIWSQTVYPTSTTIYSLQCYNADWIWTGQKNIKIIVK